MFLPSEAYMLPFTKISFTTGTSVLYHGYNTHRYYKFYRYKGFFIMHIKAPLPYV